MGSDAGFPQPDRTGRLDPLSGCEHKAVESCLISKPLEFEGFEVWIVDLLPDAQELDSISPLATLKVPGSPTVQTGDAVSYGGCTP